MEWHNQVSTATATATMAVSRIIVLTIILSSCFFLCLYSVILLSNDNISVNSQSGSYAEKECQCSKYNNGNVFRNHAQGRAQAQGKVEVNRDWLNGDSVNDTIKLFKAELGNKWNNNAETMIRYFAEYGTSCWPNPPPPKPEKVIAVSLYVEKMSQLPGFLQSLKLRLVEARNLYPDFRMRLYTNLPLEPGTGLCKSYCSNLDYMDMCFPTKSPIADAIEPIRFFWRFLPLGDPSALISLSRDVNNIYIQRERDAFDEWMNVYYPKGRFIHGMRDNPYHKTKILGGMWGVANYKDLNGTKPVFNRRSMTMGMRLNPRRAQSRPDQYGVDQFILADDLHPFISEKDIVSHASFHCRVFKDLSIPFPTQRPPSHIFVGGWNMGSAIKVPCPVECRPEKHQDWEFC